MTGSVQDEVVQLINTHLNRVIQAAKIGIPGNEQFQAYRTFVLDEFGQQGLLPELEAVLKQHGMVRQGREQIAGKGVPP